jgi:hypothetical protein
MEEYFNTTVMNKKENKMNSVSQASSLEDKKLELIMLRIKNKFYNKNMVLEKVASEIIKLNHNRFR